jgi:hypothetical protein
MSMDKFRYYTILFAAVLAFDGCHSNSTSPSSGGNGFSPRVGSSFTFVSQSLDSNGNIEIADTVMEIFEEVGVPFDGKTNASQVVTWINGVPFDTLYQNYETNGDVSFYQYGNSSFPGINSWVVYPFGSQHPTTVIGSGNKNGKFAQSVIDAIGTGQGTDSLLGKNYSTQKVAVWDTVIETIMPGNQSYLDTTIESPSTYSFAPQLGNIIDILSPSTRNSDGKLNGSFHEFLINYTLK